ncbi:hypothetical protein GWK47_023012 [Chionoecetes opilio]|uniref:Uncharacterized protein n=1 Tax=Chionoecetes opilio TaxID=41210 RepID=A0A8J5CJX4_CHIOP|nr:hypothetical protein GWK47_023012 [Chionoecetes opilio]
MHSRQRLNNMSFLLPLQSMEKRTSVKNIMFHFWYILEYWASSELCPEHVTNLTLNIDFVVQHITWNNPPKDSSPCHKQTAVRFILNWKSTTTNHSVEEEHQDVELCREEGAGNVEVWTEGGDGESYIVSTSSPMADINFSLMGYILGAATAQLFTCVSHLPGVPVKRVVHVLLGLSSYTMPSLLGELHRTHFPPTLCDFYVVPK